MCGQQENLYIYHQINNYKAFLVLLLLLLFIFFAELWAMVLRNFWTHQTPTYMPYAIHSRTSAHTHTRPGTRPTSQIYESSVRALHMRNYEPAQQNQFGRNYIWHLLHAYAIYKFMAWIFRWTIQSAFDKFPSVHIIWMEQKFFFLFFFAYHVELYAECTGLCAKTDTTAAVVGDSSSSTTTNRWREKKLWPQTFHLCLRANSNSHNANVWSLDTLKKKKCCTQTHVPHDWVLSSCTPSSNYYYIIMSYSFLQFSCMCLLN